MKCVIFSKDKLEYQMVKCTSSNNESIAKSIISEKFIGKFNKSEHEVIEGSILNDDNVYILEDWTGTKNLWQVCGHVTDINQSIILDLFKIRKIGVLFE